jgi:ABC-type lipoprotein export system ATPase subunit
MAEPPDESGVLLEIADLNKHYGPQQVLNQVCLRLQRAERVAIMGPSGSGKSTLLNCLAGLEPPDSGTIHFQGKDLNAIGQAEVTRLRRESLTSIFQFFHLLPTLRAWENVEFPLLLRKDPRRQRQQKVAELLEEVGLSHRASAMPSELSGGEMQRLAIARALITEPALILADEPTGSLDSKTSERVLELLKTLTDRHHTALLMVTHDNEAASVCTRRLHMRDGRLMEQPE